MSNIVLTHCPKYKESGLFVIKSKLFVPAKNGDLLFMYSESTSVDTKVFETINVSSTVPAIFVEKNLSTTENVWFDNFIYLLVYFFLWFFVMLSFIFKKELVQFSYRFFDFFYVSVLCILIFFLGCFCGGQPSIVNIFAFTNFLVKGGSVATFLFDPFFIISWFFIILTLLLWGRAFFCGWICPFGSLQELLFRLREFFLQNIFSVEFFSRSTGLLNYFRFFVFLFLFCLSFYSFEKAEIFSEIEPFKTIWNISLISRGFLSFYVIFILVSSLVMYRWFCRFVCPLGAFLSFFSKFSKFTILRRNACVKCNICRKLCKSKAITNFGQIDATKCLGCFDCVNAMYDKTICPPLINKKIWIAFNEKN
jgi:NosR/NirI family nitrous oxide reductase transcriptional regulator